MTLQIFDFPQGSPEWLACRMGLVTASEFKTIIGVKKDAREKVTRQTYMRKLAGEILTGEPMESYTNANMERGKELEDEARATYQFVNDAALRQVGFIQDGLKGCSPDSLVAEDGGLEIKIALPHIQIERLECGELPSEYVAQVQGNIWIAKREWWDFASYCPRLPLFVVRVRRDEAYIRMLSEAVDQFNAELAALVEKIRRYGGPKEKAA